MGSGITGPGSGILSCGIGMSSAVRWSGTVFRQKNALRGRTCSLLKTQLYFWRNNNYLFRYLSVHNTTFLVRHWLSAGSCLAIDSFLFWLIFCNYTLHSLKYPIVWVFWLQNKDLIRKHSYNGRYLLPMISFCTPNNDFIHALSTVKDEVFQWTKPCYHCTCYCTRYCNLTSYSTKYFSADHAQQTIHGLLQAFSSSRFQASDQSKYQVASVGRRRHITKPVLIMLARNSAKHLNQTYKALQGVGVVDPGSVK